MAGAWAGCRLGPGRRWPPCDEGHGFGSGVAVGAAPISVTAP